MCPPNAMPYPEHDAFKIRTVQRLLPEVGFYSETQSAIIVAIFCIY